MEARQAFLLAAASLLAITLPSAHGHGFMYEPKARNVVHNSDYCPHCLSAGGPYEVSAGSSLVWPAGVHGYCGDKAGDRKHESGGVYGPAGVQATYNSGDVITISLLITARHGGRFVFRLCDRTDVDEGCFDAHVLQRADGTGPYTWTSPQGGAALPASGYSTGSAFGYSGEVYNMQYKLPDGLSCSACTLQWWWTTGNSCDVPGSPFGGTGMSSCTSQGPYPEEFWNCADIAIGGGATPTPTPETTTPTPETTTPTPETTTPTPETTTPTPETTTPTPETTTPTPETTTPTPETTTPTPETIPSSPDRKIFPGGCSQDPSCFCTASGDGLFAAPWSCAEFMNCGGGSGAAQRCGDGTLWDTAATTCNFADQVDCGSRPR